MKTYRLEYNGILCPIWREIQEDGSSPGDEDPETARDKEIQEELDP